MVAETSQTLDRGLRVLSALANAPAGLSITELATEVEVNRTVVYRLVATLEQHGLARRDATGRLHVGLGVLALARGLHPVLRGLAGPVLRALAEELGTTAHLTVADGGEALAIAVIEPTWTDFHVAYRVGARHPLTQGAAGKAILMARGSHPDTGSVTAPSIRAGSGLVSGPHAGRGVVPAARFVETVAELQAGARGIAAPVLGVEGLEASVGIVTLGELDASVVGPKVTSAAAEVARRLC